MDNNSTNYNHLFKSTSAFKVNLLSNSCLGWRRGGWENALTQQVTLATFKAKIH